MTSRLFSGSTTLSRFILRRDRVSLFIWLVGIAGFVVALVPVFENLVTSGTDRTVMSAMMENPAMVALLGPVYGKENFTTGAAYGNMMLIFTVLIGGVMNIYFVARHTRQDEELGRMEVIRSLPVGRLANLASTMLVSAAFNIVLAVFTGVGMYFLRADGMDFSGCMLFGAALGVIGFFFAGVTAILVQCTANNRTALGLSIMLLFLLYMMRAVGDMGTEVLSFISPLGLVLRIESFVNNYWWPVFVIFAISLALTAIAFLLANSRDLGRGLVPERPGRRHASSLLSSPYGLALKLLRTSILVWVITIFSFAAMYGSVFGDLESFISNNDMLRAIFAANTEFTLAEQFISLLMAIMSMIAAIAPLTFINRIHSEEKNGYAEQLFGRAVSRYEQMAAYFIPALVLSAVLQLLSALGFWSVGSMVLDTAPSLHTFLQSAFSYLPALWLMMGIAIALVAYLPKFANITYVYLGYAFFSVYLGTIANFPEWVKKLSPFGHISQYPIEELEILPLVILTVMAVGLIALGFFGYARRDMKTQ